jgi:hypothetical protein
MSIRGTMMKCYYHPTNESVAICSSCGKAGCHQCIHASKAGMLCSHCMTKSTTKAKLTILISVLFAIGGACFGFYIGQSSGRVIADDPIGHLITDIIVFSYIFWATFWGWGPVWRIWRKVTSGIGCASSVFLFPIILCVFFEIPFFFACCYGILGGGIFEFIKVLMAAKRKVNCPQQPSQSFQGPQQQWGQQPTQQPSFQQNWNAPSSPQPSQQWDQQPTQQPSFQQNWNAPLPPQPSQQWGQQPTQQPPFQQNWNAPSSPQPSQQWGQQPQ